MLAFDTLLAWGPMVRVSARARPSRPWMGPFQLVEFQLVVAAVTTIVRPSLILQLASRSY